MIRITADLLAFGVDGAPIAVLEIANRQPRREVCDYDYRFASQDDGGNLVLGPWRIVRGHRRTDGVWALVSRVLAAGEDGELSEYVSPALDDLSSLA